jgi:hypothetical protein
MENAGLLRSKHKPVLFQISMVSFCHSNYNITRANDYYIVREEETDMRTLVSSPSNWRNRFSSSDFNGLLVI